MVAAAAPAFIYTVERRDKLFNVPGVLNGDADNFFGGLVTATSQPFNIALHNVEATSTATTQLEVSLRGLTLQPHFVNVRLNGTLVGTVQFANEDPAVQTITVPLTQEDLAGLAGTSRATVNRVLRDEESRGTVTLGRGKTVVIDLETLTRRAQ